MINEAVDYIRREVRDHLGVVNSEVITGSVRLLEQDAGGQGAYITLINLVADPVSRNLEQAGGKTSLRGRQARPDSYRFDLLFAFAFQDYDTSLRRLSQTLALFRENPIFAATNQTSANSFPAALDKLTFTLRSLNFEELHHLWRALGSAYLPSVLFEVRMVAAARKD